MTDPQITVLLEAARGGDAVATEELFHVIYEELKVIARSHRRRWRGNDTLNTTAILNESFIKLAGRDVAWRNRTHFFATASKAMRHILVNYAERQRAAKRGGDAVHVPLHGQDFATAATADEMLTVNRLLERLESENPRRCRIVECRIFGGMSIDETGDALGISAATVKRDWRYCSAWLYRELGTGTEVGSDADSDSGALRPEH